MPSNYGGHPFYAQMDLRRFAKAEVSGPEGKLLGQEFQGREFVVEAVQFAAEDLLVVPLFLLQGFNLQDPAFHNGGAGAVALDEVIGKLLEECARILIRWSLENTHPYYFYGDNVAHLEMNNNDPNGF